MDTNFAAWMIGGGPNVETQAQAREREHLYAYRESQRAAIEARPGILDRIRSLARPQATAPAAACCAA